MRIDLGFFRSLAGATLVSFDEMIRSARRPLVQSLELRQLFAVPGVALDIYHTAAQLANDLQDFVNYRPDLARLVSIGKSVHNVDIWALEISDNVNVQEDEPEVYYQGSMHGDEPVGQSNVMHFADMLLSSYGTDTTITDLVNNTEFWLVPQMNPDGFLSVTRYNANGVDLNRNFPEGSVNSIGTIYSGPAASTAGRAVETVAMMNFQMAHSFTLGANFHGGSTVVNYPYDTNSDGIADYAASPDDGLYRSVAAEYAKTNNDLLHGDFAPTGITNGDQWYEVAGGLQDWSYRYLGVIHTTIELWDTKKPSTSTLATRWTANRDSMINYAKTAQWGIRGVVTDAATGAPLFARITIVGNTQPVFTDPDVGDFHRLALPGTYTVKVEAPGHLTQTFSNISVASGSTTRLDVQLAVPDTIAPTVAAAAFDHETSHQRIALQLSEDIGASFIPGDLTLTNTTTVTDISATSYQATYDAATRSILIAPASPLADGRYRLSLAAGTVADGSGNSLAAYHYDFTMLRGDANNDGAVGFADLVVLAQQYGTSGNTFSTGNFDYDDAGNVDFSDLVLLAQNYNVSLATTALAASPTAVTKERSRVATGVLS